jgi:predicted MFS family arabinose efflux permease
MQSSDWGWTAPTTVMLLAGGLAAIVLFVIVEFRRAAPLIELDLLRIPTFTGGNLVFAVFQFEKMAMFIFVALYLQHELGRSPIEAGLTVTAAIVPTLVTSRIAGRLRDRIGARIPALVALLVTAATIFVIGFATILGSHTLLAVALIVWGAVMPGIAVPLRPALMGAVPATKQGQASGVNLSIQMLGGTFGIAVCSVLLAASGTYWPVFALTGCATLLAALIAWLMVERP